ncbi:MAG: endonuclease domain-containing protein [Clostridia bacterium]|nr:endonuclease domain-containing protein [Clostridia bacterium]
MENSFLPRNKKLKGFSRALRNNATQQENRLWYQFLRTYPVRFNRQRIIGNYIVDFYCDKAKLVVELDGSQHYQITGEAKDIERDKYLESLNLKVLRFSNADINKHFYEVCTVIDNTAKERINN